MYDERSLLGCTINIAGLFILGYLSKQEWKEKDKQKLENDRRDQEIKNLREDFRKMSING